MYAKQPEMAERRTASAAVTFREKEFILGMLWPRTTGGARTAKVVLGLTDLGFVSVKAGCLKNYAVSGGPAQRSPSDRPRAGPDHSGNVIRVPRGWLEVPGMS